MTRKIVQRAFGGPEELSLIDAPPLTYADLAPGEVLVAATAASINPIDIMTRTGGGMAAVGIISVPYTPGWDVAGTVEAVGESVEGFDIGQRVMGLLNFPHLGSAYASQVIARAEDLIAVPDNLSDIQAGALPMAAMTAWQAFADTTSVSPGQRVLITGAGGGVGHFAVQIAHHLGAHVVAIASSGKHEWLKSLGADETIDYRDESSVAGLEGSIDVALSLAEGSRHTALRAVKPGGTLIGLGGGVGDIGSDAGAAGIRFEATHVHTQREWLEKVTELAAQGELIPTVSKAFDLASAADAYRAVESGHSTGKIVLAI